MNQPTVTPSARDIYECRTCKQVFCWSRTISFELRLRRHSNRRNAICPVDAELAPEAVQAAYKLGGGPAVVAIYSRQKKGWFCTETVRRP